MTIEEIKLEIQKSLDRVPESILYDILDFLKQAESKTTSKTDLVNHLKKILAEDKELLERLAK